jgi:hypothetical protein
MGLNPTGSEIPRSLTEIGTTIDVALDGKADFVRVTDNPAGNTVASSYEITGSLSHTGGGVVTPLVLDYVSPNFWADSVGGSLVVSSGKWLLTLDFQAVWLSNETIATPPEDCVWGADENTVGDPILTFTRATVATTGQFALADDGVYDPVMWQNIGDDVTPNWVPLTTATALSAHTTATGNVHSLSAANVRSILAVSTLSGSNTGDQNLAPYATTSAVAAGYVPRITSVDNRLTRFDGTTGAVQIAGITVDDSNNVTGVASLEITPASDGQSTIRINTAGGTRSFSHGTFPDVPSFSGLWAGSATPSTANYAFLSNGSTETIFNVPNAGGSIQFRFAGSPNPGTLNFTSSLLSLNANTAITGNLTASGTVTSTGGSIVSSGTISNYPSIAVVAGGHGISMTADSTQGYIQTPGNTIPIDLQGSGVKIGSGATITRVLSATATLDFPSIGSNDTETLTITVTGAVAGDSVLLGCPAGLDAGLIFCASVTAADTVTVRMHNSSGGSIDPASGTFRATVIRF